MCIGVFRNTQEILFYKQQIITELLHLMLCHGLFIVQLDGISACNVINIFSVIVFKLNESPDSVHLTLIIS